MMKRSMVKANEAMAKWDRRNAELRTISDEKGLSKGERALYRAGDLELKDHYATYSFFAGDVHRFGTMILAERAMQELMEE